MLLDGGEGAAAKGSVRVGTAWAHWWFDLPWVESSPSSVFEFKHLIRGNVRTDLL